MTSKRSEFITAREKRIKWTMYLLDILRHPARLAFTPFIRNVHGGGGGIL